MFTTLLNDKNIYWQNNRQPVHNCKKFLHVYNGAKIIKIDQDFSKLR